MRLLGGDVNCSPPLEAVLVLATRGALVLRLAREAVGVTTHRALKHVHLILVDAPAAAVRRAAVKTARFARLRLLDAQHQKTLVQTVGHQLSTSTSPNSLSDRLRDPASSSDSF